MDLKEFAIDTDKEVRGTWVPMGDKGGRFLIGSSGSKAYMRRVQELREPHLKELKRGERLEESIADAITVTAMVDCILLGWEGVKINGQDLPYSKEAARAALADPRLVAFRGWVSEQSQRFENFQLEHFEDLMGNLLRSSATTVQ